MASASEELVLFLDVSASLGPMFVHCWKNIAVFQDISKRY